MLENIEPGTTVKVREIRTVEGYVLDGTPQDIKIVGGQAQTLTFWNKRAGVLVIQKKDSVSGALISGAQFQLTYANGGYVDADNGHLSSNGLYTTDANGEIRISGITGTVVAKEVKAASGYVIDPATQVQTVTVNPMDTQTLVFLNEPLCSLTITKLDSVTGKPVPGTVFAVKDGNGNELGRYTTGKDGTVTVTGLVPGSTVVVVEVSVPSGYVLDTTPQTIIVRNGTGNSVITGAGANQGGSSGGNGLTFENDPKMTLTIHKYIEGTANEPLAGVAFKVVDGSGAAVGPGNGVFYTDSTGEIVIEGLEPGTTVTAHEIKTVDGFVLDGTPQTVKITAGSKAPELTFWNKRTCSLTILKQSTSKVPLAGAVFHVTDEDGAAIGANNGRYTSDRNGLITITGLQPGQVLVVTEEKAPNGYVLDTTPKTIKIRQGSANSLIFENAHVGSLVINKRSSADKKTPLEGVTFKITTANGAFLPDENGKISSNGLYYTDENGQIVLNNVVGTLVVTEVASIDGYTISSANRTQTVEVRPDDTQMLYFYNDPLCSLTITKLDSVTGKPLSGAVFTVKDGNGNVLGRCTTGKDGTATVTNLVPNSTVVVTETSAPNGYVLDSMPQTVVVKSGVKNNLTFENDPKTTLVIEKYITGTTTPLKGVAFLVTDSSGAVVGSSNGEYITDENGRIVLTDLVPGTTITARETRTAAGFVLDSTPQSILIKQGAAQTMTFFNKAEGGLELIKVNEADATQRIPGVTFEIRRMDGGLVETVTTGKDGRVRVNLAAGDYYAVETETAQGFKLDNTPHYFTVKDGKTTTLTVKNKPLSSILIHKTDSVTGKGLYGVNFLLYDAANTPIGQYSSDNQGYVYIENLTAGGRYYLRELENPGYVPDTQMKTVYVKAGETTLIEWQNTPVTGQIQITKTSADYNSLNGWPAGTPIPNTEFEIYNYRTGVLVDTIRTDKNGVAVSKPLPLGRYKVVESKAADFYSLDKTPIEVELEHAGQIVKAAMTNKSLYTNVSIKKTGYAEVMPGQSIRYTFSEIGNNSNTSLTSFYWRDTLPVNAVRLDKIVTGTYNAAGSYKVVYKTNLSGSKTYTMYDNLSTAKNYVLDASPAALKLASNEYVTEFSFVFGVVPAKFRQVEAPQVYCKVVSWVKGGSQFTNTADVGGVYNGQWIQAVTRWTTKVYGKPAALPKTGY